MADKTECDGSEIWKPKTSDLESCAQSCRGISSMFLYGTNDFGSIRCYTDGCSCVCETAAMPDGTCSRIGNNGWKLYKYEEGKLRLEYIKTIT